MRGLNIGAKTSNYIVLEKMWILKTVQETRYNLYKHKLRHERFSQLKECSFLCNLFQGD